MALKKRSASIHKKASMPVSYQMLDENGLYDARNVFDNKGVTETRNGIKRYNSTSLGGEVLSASYFKNTSGNRYKIVKVGTVLYSVASSGAHTSIKTGLSADTKHRGVTMNDRHIIAVENDGLFSWDGTTFTQLGQAAPASFSVANTAGGSLTDTNQYRVAVSYYASSIGFESNALNSSTVTIAAATGLRISVTSIPATASNALVDSVRIYLKNLTTNGSYYLVTQQALGTTSYNIDSEAILTTTTTTTNAPPISGGGKYLTSFGACLAYAGNDTYKNDVFISEEYVPDGYDDTTTSKTLQIPGQGEITGIACGLYDNSHLRPFLAIFKKTSTTVYSELDGSPVQTTIDDHVGCVSHDTIKVRNGVVYFMSENGFYALANGSIIKDETSRPVSLGGGAIDDIFSREGWVYQLNSSQYSNFFSAYYPTLGHYLTFVSEGSNSSFSKAYNFEERIGGFRVYDFKTSFNCATEGEDDSGNQCVFLGDGTGYLYTLSVKNSRHDEDENGDSETIPAFFYLPFTMPGDDSCSYNFRQLVVKALNSENEVTVKAFPGYNLNQVETLTFDFSNDAPGFILDMSKLDEGVLADDRVPTAYMTDVNSTGETMVIGFFQDILDANIGIISSQLFYNKNGNRNL